MKQVYLVPIALEECRRRIGSGKTNALYSRGKAQHAIAQHDGDLLRVAGNHLCALIHIVVHA